MIEVANRQQRVRLPAAKIRRLVRVILNGEKASLSLSFAFVDGREMRMLNRRHLKHDFDTDVLSFPIEPHFGEIVISTDFAAAEASKRRIPVEEELLRYVAHGVLHLLGYDDHVPKEKRRMWKRQEAYLQRVVGA